MSELIKQHEIQGKIYLIRGKQVMLDRDLAELYQVETRALNQAVKRNINRFPDDFMFQLTNEEVENLKSQFVISSFSHGGLRNSPFVFTEQGVSMLASVLKSKIAVSVSIQIIRIFVSFRKFTSDNVLLFEKVNKIENKLTEHDKKLEQLINTPFPKNEGIFYDGQIFDAYAFISQLIKSAHQSILLIDNYIDETVLTLLSKRNKNVEIIIYTSQISKQLKLDLDKFNAQYAEIKVEVYKKSHDRFLIIDKAVYHIGASLKDLGKKWFAFSKIDIDIKEIITKLDT